MNKNALPLLALLVLASCALSKRAASFEEWQADVLFCAKTRFSEKWRCRQRSESRCEWKKNKCMAVAQKPPTASPTSRPTATPTSKPTPAPSTAQPTAAPTMRPTSLYQVWESEMEVCDADGAASRNACDRLKLRGAKRCKWVSGLCVSRIHDKPPTGSPVPMPTASPSSSAPTSAPTEMLQRWTQIASFCSTLTSRGWNRCRKALSPENTDEKVCMWSEEEGLCIPRTERPPTSSPTLPVPTMSPVPPTPSPIATPSAAPSPRPTGLIDLWKAEMEVCDSDGGASRSACDRLKLGSTKRCKWSAGECISRIYEKPPTQSPTLSPSTLAPTPRPTIDVMERWSLVDSFCRGMTSAGQKKCRKAFSPEDTGKKVCKWSDDDVCVPRLPQPAPRTPAPSSTEVVEPELATVAPTPGLSEWDLEYAVCGPEATRGACDRLKKGGKKRCMWREGECLPRTVERP